MFFGEAACGAEDWQYLRCMSWQQTASLAIVAGTAGVFVWARWRRRKFSFERDTHCGCAAAGEQGQKSSIVYRARKGERPVVIVKMR